MMDTLASILDLELAGVTVRHAGIALAILFASLLLRRIAVDVLLARLHRIFQRTSATWDDQMVETSRSPLRWLITLYGLWLAVRVIAMPMDLPELREWLDEAGQLILLFVGAWWMFRLVDVVDALLRERAADPNDWMERGLVPLFVSSLRILVVLVSGLVIAQNLGYSVAGLIASLGLGGAAIALASQDTIANLFGSVMILADKPFKVGDWIKGDGFEGIVEEIGFRSTRIRTFAQTVENVPNKLLASVRVENVDRRRDPGLNVRRVEMNVGVTYRTTAEQMERTLEAIRTILKEDPGVDQRMFQLVSFTDFGDSALTIYLYYFSDKADWAYHLGVRERVNLKIMRALEELGVQVAFPTRSIYIESVPRELALEAPPPDPLHLHRERSPGARPRSAPRRPKRFSRAPVTLPAERTMESSSPPEMPEAAAAALDERLDKIPPSPGVYLLRDASRKVIYVGKAKSLRARVRSYFRGGDERMQVPFLIRRVADVETLVTRNEKEALILENNLIKQYKPRYNIRLKDDKSYVSAKVTVRDEWPRVLVTRRVEKDGNRYFGPFHSAWAVRASLDAIRKVFPLRNCSDTVFRNRARPCLEYQIKRCPGPCCLPVDREEYARNLKSAILFLEGRNAELVRDLKKRMAAASEDLRFEDAARLRDQIRALEKTSEPQEMVSHFGLDQDVFGLYREGGFLEIQVLAVRRGKLTGSLSYSLADREFADEDVIAEVLGQFYSAGRYLPDEVLVPVDLEDAEVRASYLSELKGKKITVFRPQRGDRVRLVEMACENARQAFAARQSSDEQRSRQADELRRRLGLRGVPRRIECFDISNLQGRSVVGSKVAFEDGEPDKSRYRRYRVKTVAGQDDFASLYEVLKRRLARGLEEKELPDLLVIDGGKGQLGVATAVLAELAITDLDVVGLAKDRVESDARGTEIRHSEERVFLPGRKNPVVLPRNSNALFLLQRLRDEAHRFAITFHRELRGRERFRSVLDDIAGVGPERRRRLLRHFGSVRALAAASAEEIATVPGIGPDLAGEIASAARARERAPRKGGRLTLRPIGKTPAAGEDPRDRLTDSE